MAMTHPSPTLNRTTWPGDHDIATWSRVASRASHPSSQLPDQSWLWSIASGLASSTPPWSDEGTADGIGGGRREARGSIVLSTSAYQVWHVAWPEGTPVELPDTLDVQSFCVVEGALRVIDRSSPDSGARLYGSGSGMVLTTPHAVLVAEEPRTSAVHVVLHGSATGSEPLPWMLRGDCRPAASGARR
jgi:hypothetical protein